MIAKEIRRFKIAVNSACPLRCDYCLLDKDAGETLPLPEAVRAVDFFLDSPGARKKLLLYGGEPLLALDLLRAIVDHAEAAARRRGKELCATVATSGVVLSAEILSWLKERDVHVSISIDGGPSSHDRFRRYKDGRPSHAAIARRVPAFLEALGPRAVTALMCVHPDNAGSMLEDFRYLVEGLGFENVNIEVVHGFPWSEAALAAFAQNLEAIGRFIKKAVADGRFVFLESFAIPLQREPVAQEMCPLHSCLELFPSGDYSLYPFPFVEGLEKRPLVTVGTVEKGLTGRFRDCRFDAESGSCRNCAKDYYTLPKVSEGNAPYERRTRSAQRWISEIAAAASKSPVHRAYLKEAVARSALGYR